jgi:hypothetical protein
LVSGETSLEAEPEPENAPEVSFKVPFKVPPTAPRTAPSAASCADGPWDPGGETPRARAGAQTDLNPTDDDDEEIRKKFQETACAVVVRVFSGGRRPERIADHRDQRLLYRLAYLVRCQEHRSWVLQAIEAAEDRRRPTDPRKADSPLGYLQAVMRRTFAPPGIDLGRLLRGIPVPPWALADPRNWRRRE